MDAESFFQRWSRRKTSADEAENRQAAEPSAPSAPVVADEAERPPPTLEDVAGLTPDADFKPFVARGVDEGVRRAAMKKLFSDPHFNVMDGLDIYIDDYSKFEPIPASMLAAMNHAQALLNPAAQLETSLMQLLQTPEKTPEAAETPAAISAQDASGNDGRTVTGNPEADTQTTPDKPTDDHAI